jgi:O-antigen/teichoic acid export membrane protein
MSQTVRIKRNSLFAFLTQFIRLFANVVVFVLIARYYGPIEFGQFTTAHAMATIFLLIADFGFDVLLSSEIARHRHRATGLVQKYFTMKLIFAFLATCIMTITTMFQHLSESTRMLMYVFSLFVFCSALLNFFFALFKSLEQFNHETKISFIVNLGLLLMIVVLGLFHAPVVLIVVAFIFSRIIGLLLALSLARRIGPMQGFTFSFISKEEFSKISVFGFQAIFGTLFSIQDTIFLSWWSGDREVGLYQSVFRIFIISLLISDILSTTLLPVFSRLYVEKRKRWSELGRIMHKTLLYCALPIAFVLIVYSEEIVTILYGLENYREAIPILRILGLVVIVRYFVEASAINLTSSGRQSLRLVIVMCAVPLNFIMNRYVIPLYGGQGVAAVALITNALVGISYVVAARKESYKWLVDWKNYIPLLVTVILGIFLWNIHGVASWFLVPISITALLVIIYFIGFTKDERKLLFSFQVSYNENI